MYVRKEGKYPMKNVKLFALVALVVVALGLWLGLSAEEWAFMVAAIALVFAGEMLNTVFERRYPRCAPFRASRGWRWIL